MEKEEAKQQQPKKDFKSASLDEALRLARQHGDLRYLTNNPQATEPLIQSTQEFINQPKTSILGRRLNPY